MCEYNLIGKMCSLYSALVLGEVYFYHRFTVLTPPFSTGGLQLLEKEISEKSECLRVPASDICLGGGLLCS